jgi:hypothetical protein
MIPLPPAAKKILAWLPHVLNGYDYPVIETDGIVPDLSSPAITFYFSSVGILSQFSNQMLRTTVNVAQERDEHWGQYHYATMNVVLRSPDKAEMEAMWFAFYNQCLATRRNMVIWLDGARFLEVLDSKPMPPQRSKSGTSLFWAQVDLRFEYEVSNVPDEEFIKTISTEMQIGESEDHLSWVSEVHEEDLPVDIVAYIAPAVA